MPKQGETFINAVGVEVVAHGGSTPAAPDFASAKANALSTFGDGTFDVFGRTYDDTVPAFFSTGGPFVIDRLFSKNSGKTGGGNTFRFLTFSSLQELADENGHIWGDNELGIPPNEWLENNPGYKPSIGWGYGENSPYGPEYGNEGQPGNQNWKQIGINTYEYTFEGTGGAWSGLLFQAPAGDTYVVRFNVTKFEGVGQNVMALRAGTDNVNDLFVNGVGSYEATVERPVDGMEIRLTFIEDVTDGHVIVDNVVIRSQSPPISTVAPIVTGPADEPGFLTCDGGEWNGAEVLTYQWYRNGDLMPGKVADIIQTFFEDGLTDFRCDVMAENVNGITGPVASNTFRTEEFGALDVLGFDFATADALAQDAAGQIPVTAFGDRIGLAVGTGLSIFAETDDQRPTWIDSGHNGLGLAQHVADWVADTGNRLTTGALPAPVVEGNTASLFYVYRVDAAKGTTGVFSMASLPAESDWNIPQAVSQSMQDDGRPTIRRGNGPIIYNAFLDLPLGTLGLIEYHCSPTENRSFINGVQGEPNDPGNDNPTDVGFSVNQIMTGVRWANNLVRLYGNISFGQFVFEVNMSAEDQVEMRATLMRKWAILMQWNITLAEGWTQENNNTFDYATDSTQYARLGFGGIVAGRTYRVRGRVANMTGSTPKITCRLGSNLGDWFNLTANGDFDFTGVAADEHDEFRMIINDNIRTDTARVEQLYLEEVT